MTRPEAVVVGAGFAGLSAASALAAAGVRVLVVDARPQLGGRATAFVDRETGELVDNGQHVLFGCYRETFAFLRRIGAEDNIRLQPSLSVPYLDTLGRRSELRCPPLPPPLHLLAAVLDWDAMPWRDRFSALRLAGPLRRARRELKKTGRISAARAGRTVAEWLDEHGQGQRVRKWLWEPLAIAALNQAPEDASAEPFVRVLAEMFGSDTQNAAIGVPLLPLHLMYAEPARRFIEAHGGEVRTGALARVVCDRQAIDAVEVRGESVGCGRVVAAVPWFALRSLFAGDVPRGLEDVVSSAGRMQSMPIVTINLWYDRPVMEDVFAALPGRAMQWVFDKRMAFGEQASHLSLVASGAEALVGAETTDLVERAAAEVQQALPGARGARVLRGTVIREKRATFSLAPGQPSRPRTETEVRGLWLAGDWIETGFPGTIESAVISGHRAARAVLASRTASDVL